MILLDTGPLVAAFDRSDQWHEWCLGVFRNVHEPLATTVPVLTEAFHFLRTTSVGARKLMELVSTDGFRVLFLDDECLQRAVDLMIRYKDTPMDFADASLVAVAESHHLRSILTLDLDHFSTYRFKRGYSHDAFVLFGTGMIHLAPPPAHKSQGFR